MGDARNSSCFDGPVVERVIPKVLRIALVVGLGPLLLDCGIREDEFDCEEAVVKIQDCCPGTDTSRISCDYYVSACGGESFPMLSVATSQCIVARSCAELRTGVCTRIPSLSGLRPSLECP
jgi:hypothetical protein